jgi:AFG3 family protein
MSYHEITWKEFVNSYLSRGNVERLVVVNSKWVRVELLDGNAEGQNLWFTIGSVDTFERNLENAQLDLQMESSRFIPVLYKSQIEAGNVLGAIPTLLILGFLFWSFRRASGMMGGGMPG